jgi:polar amino acid transport system ATP-binding protein
MPLNGNVENGRPLITIDKVSKSYGSVDVLRGVSIDIPEHTITCLIGASGSGKSTLLRCVNGLEPIQDGSILLDGAHIAGPGVDFNYVRTQVGIVFQSYNLFPHMTVLDNVALAPRHVLGQSKKSARAQGMELLTRVGLKDKADSYPDRLSGGQQQRAAIARALSMQPRVMLLDEITSALDPELVGEVLTLVRDLADDGMTMILATHEMSFAREVAHQVCFLEAGAIYERGSADAIFGDPKGERTKAFLSRVIAAGRL